MVFEFFLMGIFFLMLFLLSGVFASLLSVGFSRFFLSECTIDMFFSRDSGEINIVFIFLLFSKFLFISLSVHLNSFNYKKGGKFIFFPSRRLALDHRPPGCHKGLIHRFIIDRFSRHGS